MSGCCAGLVLIIPIYNSQLLKWTQTCVKTQFYLRIPPPPPRPWICLTLNRHGSLLIVFDTETALCLTGLYCENGYKNIIFSHLPLTSSHLHPLQIENCGSNSRLVVDEYYNGKLKGLNIMEILRDREISCSASDRQGANFESCVWRTVSFHSPHHSQEVFLAQFSLYVHTNGIKPHSLHCFA